LASTESGLIAMTVDSKMLDTFKTMMYTLCVHHCFKCVFKKVRSRNDCDMISMQSLLRAHGQILGSYL